VTKELKALSTINVTTSMGVRKTGIRHACIRLLLMISCLLLHAMITEAEYAAFPELGQKSNKVYVENCNKDTQLWCEDGCLANVDPLTEGAFKKSGEDIWRACRFTCKCRSQAWNIGIDYYGCCETVKQKKKKDRCPKHQFWCKKVFQTTGRSQTHQCDCAVFDIDNSGYCQKCGWVEYREETPSALCAINDDQCFEPLDKTCQPCPYETLFTDYKWDPRTKHPCLSCGDAFRMLEDYTKKRGWSPKHYEAYSNDFSHHKELQCIADMKKKCTDKERNLAGLMVVSYSEASGRTCNFCHQPTYFFNGKCVGCPLGMQSATPLEDSKLFIPEDVQLANPADGSATSKYNREPAEFPQDNFAEFGCRACSVSQGVRDPSHTQCTPCAAIPVPT